MIRHNYHMRQVASREIVFVSRKQSVKSHETGCALSKSDKAQRREGLARLCPPTRLRSEVEPQLAALRGRAFEPVRAPSTRVWLTSRHRDQSLQPVLLAWNLSYEVGDRSHYGEALAMQHPLRFNAMDRLGGEKTRLQEPQGGGYLTALKRQVSGLWVRRNKLRVPSINWRNTPASANLPGQISVL